MPPSLFPLNSEQLSNLSAALKSSATNLAHNAVEAAERWQYIYGLGLAGESFNAAYEQEDMTHRASRQTAAQLAELARTMDKAAAKQKVLDGLAQYALPFLEAEGEINIPVSIFMTQLGTLARALDLATAFAASMIGGDDTKVRGLTLADFGDMSAAEINEINSHRLTPEAAAALEEFTKDRKPGDPPMHVLEVEPGKMVVAVGDIDTADSITTLVAGVGSSNPAGWATYLHRTTRTAPRSCGWVTTPHLPYPPPSAHALSVRGRLPYRRYRVRCADGMKCATGRRKEGIGSGSSWLRIVSARCWPLRQRHHQAVWKPMGCWRWEAPELRCCTKAS